MDVACPPSRVSTCWVVYGFGDFLCCAPVNIDPAWADTVVWWCFSEELRENTPVFLVGCLEAWLRTATDLRYSHLSETPSLWSVNRRAVPVWRDERTPVWLCTALALGKCCARNRSCFCEEEGGDFTGEHVCSVCLESSLWATSHQHLLHLHVQVMVEVLDSTSSSM